MFDEKSGGAAQRNQRRTVRFGALHLQEGCFVFFYKYFRGSADMFFKKPMKLVNRLFPFFLVIFFNQMAQAQQPPTLVIMGSSTAAGSGASTADSSWAGRYTRYLQQFYPEVRVINLAVGGYGTHHLLPNGWTIPDGRPLPDHEHNITRALSYKPDAIILNLPSNDASQSYPADEQLANFATIVGQAQEAGALVWVTTTQPRNFELHQIEIQRQVRDGLIAQYGNHCIDFWDVLATPEGTIDPRYDCGDGIHINDSGHRQLAQKVVSSNILVSWLGISKVRAWWDGVLGRLVRVI